MGKTLCICLASLVLSSCSTTAEYGRKVVDYSKQMGSWIGQKVESLYAEEGEPSSVKQQPDGGTVIEYKHNQTVEKAPDTAATAASPGQAVPSAATESQVTAANDAATPVNVQVVPCTTRYRADSSGTIRSWTIDGAGCKAIQETPPPAAPSP
jgi:hypothetical protein